MINKYRAWDKEKKVMCDVLQLSMDDSGVFAACLDYGKTGGSVFSDTFELIQFAGRQDKNETDLYVGDLCRDDCGDIMEIKFGPLPLNKSGDCVCTFDAFYAKSYGSLGSPAFYECNQIGDWFEIIGNIWENPELIDA